MLVPKFCHGQDGRRHQVTPTLEGDDAVIVEISLVDEVTELRFSRVQPKLLHDMAEFIGSDITLTLWSVMGTGRMETDFSRPSSGY